MLNIWYGRERIDREKFIYSSIEKGGGQAIVIVPDQYTLEAEKQAFRNLGTDVLLDVEVLSLSRLGQRILSKTGGDRRTFIDKYGRYMILSGIIADADKSLTVFRGVKDRGSFIDMVSDFISEMKQYNVTPEDVLAMGEGLSSKGDMLREKLKDLHLIFRMYEKAIEGKYTDSEDRLALLAKAIEDCDDVEAASLWVYGFDSFTPKNLDIIGALMGKAVDVNVVLMCDFSPEYDELFRLSKIVINRLKAQAEDRNIGYRLSQIDERFAVSRPPAIKAIESSMYSLNPVPSRDWEGLTVVRCANLYNEAESAAGFVLGLIRDEGLRYRDIAVICNDTGKRSSILRRVFREYGVDFFDDEKRSILSSPLATYVVSLLETAAGRFPTPDLIKTHKSGLSPMSDDEIEEIENYAIKYRIKGTMWKKPFTKGRMEYGDDGMEVIDVLREKTVAPALAVEEMFKSSKTFRDFLVSYYGFLAGESGVRDKLAEIAELQSRSGLFDLAAETSQSWSMVMGAFEQMAELMGDDPFDVDKLLEILKAGLSQMEIGVLPPSADDVLIGTMQRTRTGSVKAMLVVGANEGLIPMAPSTEGLFSVEELEYFAEEGRDLCKTDAVRAMEETLAIYRNLSKAEKHLYISYSAADDEGGEIKPSQLISDLRRLFPRMIIRPDSVNSGDSGAVLGGRVNTLRRFTEELHKARRNEKIDPVWEAVRDWIMVNEPEDLKMLKSGLEFTNDQQPVPREEVKALFLRSGDARSDTLSISPSRAESFSRCPFSHFIAYGLRPEERRIFEASGREIGDLYHSCLMDVAKILTEKNMWHTVTREECREMVREIVERSASDYREGVFRFSNEEEYKTRRVVDACDLVCWILIEQVRAGRIKESLYEEPFGRGKTFSEIRVECESGTVIIEGKIDRVDILEDDRVKIIDYKTGEETFDIDEAAAGFRLQLMLYLEAAGDPSGTDRKPAGVFYFHVEDPREDMTRISGEEGEEGLALKIRRFFRMNGVMVDDPAVIREIDGEFDKSSDIIPVKVNKEGNVTSASATGSGARFLITEEEFSRLRSQVMETVSGLCDDLLNGRIDIHPKMSKKRTPCRYCDYKSICRFDLSFSGCRYDVVK